MAGVLMKKGGRHREVYVTMKAEIGVTDLQATGR